MLPEEKARVKIDKQLSDAGWDIVARDETPWTEVFAVEKHQGVYREEWKAALQRLANAVGAEACFYHAHIEEY